MTAFLPDDTRVVPETRPDDDCKTHKARCQCNVCQRPGAMKMKKQHWVTSNRSRYKGVTP